MKKIIVILAVLAFAVPSFAASTTDYLLQRTGETHGEGVVTWGNTTPVAIVLSAGATTGTNTLAFVDATEVVTLVGGTGVAAAGTQPCFNVQVINASAATAVAGTITWSAADLLTLNIDGPAEASQAKTTDCTGITLTACVAAANALTFTDANVTVNITVGASFVDSSYSNYYEPEACSDLAATAFTVAASGSKTITPVAMGDGTLYDTANLDFTNKTLAQFEATMEAMYGGNYLTVTIADGLDTDLANAMDSIDDISATDIEASLPMPFDAGTPPLDRLEEDRYTSLAECSYAADVGTAGTIELYDGSTLIWKAALVDDASADAWTRLAFPLSGGAVVATDGNYLTFRVQSSDTMTAASIYCLGRTD